MKNWIAQIPKGRRGGTLFIGLLLIVSSLLFWLLRPTTQWRYVTPLAQPRAFYVSTTLPDGRIVFGRPAVLEVSNEPPLEKPTSKPVPWKPGTLQIFNPKTNSWAEVRDDPARASLPKVPVEIPDNPWDYLQIIETGIRFGRTCMTGPDPFTSNDAAATDEPIVFPGGNSLFFSQYFYSQDSHTTLRKPYRSLDHALVYEGSLLNIVRLPDGRVFFGRAAPALLPIFSENACEFIFDPVKDSFQKLDDSLAASGQTATLLPSGKILLIGGVDIRYPSVFALARRIIENWWDPYGGGRLHVSFYTVPTCRLYNPATNTWTLTQPLNTARAFHTTNLLPDGRILVSGGYDRPTQDGLTNTCEIISLKDIDP